uniref:Ig-like domain-containing protein n=1 Tax=Sphaeramia orbicularis TaxID=375764 RepID=A0A673AF59_9TELE
VSTFPEIFIQIYRQTNQLKLPKPSISVTPSGQVTWGQSISITCSLTTQYSGGYFDLEKTSSSFHLVQSARSASATFSMAEVTLDNEGVYRCRYLVRDSGSDIISPLSDPLTVSVTGKNIHLKVQNPELALAARLRIFNLFLILPQKAQMFQHFHIQSNRVSFRSLHLRQVSDIRIKVVQCQGCYV